jgi:hypothetical protein
VLIFAMLATLDELAGVIYWQLLAAVSCAALPLLTFAVPSAVNEPGQLTNAAWPWPANPKAMPTMAVAPRRLIRKLRFTFFYPFFQTLPEASAGLDMPYLKQVLCQLRKAFFANRLAAGGRAEARRIVKYRIRTLAYEKRRPLCSTPVNCSAREPLQ